MAISEYGRVIDAYKDDLIGFGHMIDPAAVRQVSPSFHYELADYLLSSAIKRLVIQAPRGFAKSTVAATWKSIHHIFLEDFRLGRRSGDRRPKCVLLISKSGPHAKNLLDTIKTIIETSEFIADIFGDYSAGTHIKNTTDELMLKTGDVLIARGTGMQVRGLNKRSIRTTYPCVDDPEDEKNTKTLEAMNHNLLWLLKAVVHGVDEQLLDKVVVIGTPQHEKGMVNTLEKFAKVTKANANFRDAKAGWHSLKYSAIIKDDDGNDRSLWEERVPLKDLLAEKAFLQSQGRVSVFYSERMCQIVRDEDAMFDKWMYYKGEVERVGGKPYIICTAKSRAPLEEPKPFKDQMGREEPRVIPVNIFMGVDPAKSTSKRADKTAIVPTAMDKAFNYYVLRYFLGRRKPMGVVEQVTRMYKLHLPLVTRLEETGSEAIKDFMLSPMAEVRIPGLSIKTRPTQKKKSNAAGDTGRLDSLQNHFGAGRVWLLWQEMREAEDQLRMYPAGEDDWLDGFYWSVQSAFPPSHSADDYKTGDEGGDLDALLRSQSWAVV